MARLGGEWLCNARQARRGQVRSGKEWQSMAGGARRGMERSIRAWQARPGLDRQGSARISKAWQARRGLALHGPARNGRRGVAGQGEAGSGTNRHGRQGPTGYGQDRRGRQPTTQQPMNVYTLRVSGTPKAQPRPRAVARGGFARVYDPGTADEWKEAVKIAQVTPARPTAPIETAVRVCMTFRMPIPKTKVKTVPSGSDHTFKPDLDNLVKAVFDAMTDAGWWRDDCQVTHLTVSKVWSDSPGAIIEVYA